MDDRLKRRRADISPGQRGNQKFRKEMTDDQIFNVLFWLEEKKFRGFSFQIALTLVCHLPVRAPQCITTADRRDIWVLVH